MRLHSVALLVLATVFLFPQGYSSVDPAWGAVEEGVWHGWSDEVEVNAPGGEFTVVVDNFQLDGNDVTGVYVKVFDGNWTEVASGWYEEGGDVSTINYFDEVEVRIHGVRGDGSEWGSDPAPEAQVTIYRRREASLDTSIEASASAPASGEAPMNVTVTNDGESAVQDVVVNVTVRGGELAGFDAGHAVLSPGSLDTGESFTRSFSLETPPLTTATTSVSVDAAGRDVKGGELASSAQRSVELTGEVPVSILYAQDNDPSTDVVDIHAGARSSVSLTATNRLSIPVYLNVSVLGETWREVKLEPGEQRHFDHRFVPVRHRDLASEIQVEGYLGNGAEAPVVVKTEDSVAVHGPYLEISRKRGGDGVEVSVENTGDRDAKVLAIDPGYLSGADAEKPFQMVAPGNKYTATFPLPGPGEEVGSATALYVDVRGTKWVVETNPGREHGSGGRISNGSGEPAPVDRNGSSGAPNASTGNGSSAGGNGTEGNGSRGNASPPVQEEASKGSKQSPEEGPDFFAILKGAIVVLGLIGFFLVYTYFDLGSIGSEEESGRDTGLKMDLGLSGDGGDSAEGEAPSGGEHSPASIQGGSEGGVVARVFQRVSGKEGEEEEEGEESGKEREELREKVDENFDTGNLGDEEEPDLEEVDGETTEKEDADPGFKDDYLA